MVNKLIEVIFFNGVEAFELESVSQDASDIRDTADPDEESGQRFEFSVALVLLEGHHGDSIRELQAKAVHGVVDQDYVLQGYVLDDPQVFNVDRI